MGAIAPELMLAFAFEDYVVTNRTLPYLNDQTLDRWTFLQVWFSTTDGLLLRNGSKPQGIRCQPAQLVMLVENHVINTLPISHEELCSRSQSDTFTKLLALSQVLWFITTTSARAISHLGITLLELLTLAIVVCSIFTYALCIGAPQNVGHAIIIDIPDDELSNSILLGKSERYSTSGKNLDTLTSVSIDKFGNSVFVVFGCIVGGLHCVAWNLDFVTPQERLAWRISSATMTSLAILWWIGTWYHSMKDSDWWNYSFLGFYAIGRITTIILALMALRALPQNAFETVQWNNYFPHFSA